jgi:2-oxoglutarate dehydrogenase complex dehydrogenase (E1) component-like enzyme
LLCSGKVYYDLVEHREKAGRQDVAILRLEQLYPFPREQLFEALGSYPNVRALRWVQEEPENMGAYYYLHTVLHSGLPGEIAFSHVSREESASPATGSATLHEQEQQELLASAFEGL